MTSRHGAIASFEIQKPKEANPITPVPTETIAVKVTNDMADRRPGAPPRPVVTAPPRTTNASGSSDASPSQQEVRRRNVFRIRADSCGSTRGAFTGKKKKQAENNDEPSTSSGKKQKKKKNGKGDGKKTGAEISLVDAAALAMNDLNPSSSDLVFASLEEPTAAFRSPSMKDRKGVNSVNNNNKSSSIDRNHNREMSLQLDDLKNNTVDKYGKMSSLELSGSNDLIGHDISEFPDVEKGGPSPSPHQRTTQKKSDINHSKFENGGRKYQSTSSSPPPPPPSQHHHHQQPEDIISEEKKLFSQHALGYQSTIPSKQQQQQLPPYSSLSSFERNLATDATPRTTARMATSSLLHRLVACCSVPHDHVATSPSPLLSTPLRTLFYDKENPEFTSLQQFCWAITIGAFMGVLTAWWGEIIEWIVEVVWVSVPERLLEMGVFVEVGEGVETTGGGVPLPYYMVICPAIFGGILSYITVVLPTPIPGQNEWIEAVHIYGILDHKTFFHIIIISTLGMASGLSLGPELPLVLASGMVGSYLGSTFHQSILSARVINLTAASAAIGGFFGFPMAGALFVLEIPHRMGLQYFEALSPATIASIVAVLINRMVTGNDIKGYFNYPFLSATLPSHIFYAAILYGVVGSAIGVFYADGCKAIKTWVHDWFHHHDDHGHDDHHHHHQEADSKHGSERIPLMGSKIKMTTPTKGGGTKGICSKVWPLTIKHEPTRAAIVGVIAGALTGTICMFLPHNLFWGEAQLQTLIDKGRTPLPVFGIGDEPTASLTAYGYCLIDSSDSSAIDAGFDLTCSFILTVTKVVAIGLSLGTGIVGGHFWGPLYVGAIGAHFFNDVVKRMTSDFGIVTHLADYPCVSLLCIMGSTHVVTFRAHMAIMLILTLTISAFVPENHQGGFVGGDYSAVFPLLVVSCFVSLMITRGTVFYKQQRCRGDIIASPQVLCEPKKEGQPEYPMHLPDDSMYTSSWDEDTDEGDDSLQSFMDDDGDDDLDEINDANGGIITTTKTVPTLTTQDDIEREFDEMQRLADRATEPRETEPHETELHKTEPHEISPPFSNYNSPLANSIDKILSSINTPSVPTHQYRSSTSNISPPPRTTKNHHRRVNSSTGIIPSSHHIPPSTDIRPRFRTSSYDRGRRLSTAIERQQQQQQQQHSGGNRDRSNSRERSNTPTLMRVASYGQVEYQPPLIEQARRSRAGSGASGNAMQQMGVVGGSQQGPVVMMGQAGVRGSGVPLVPKEKKGHHRKHSSGANSSSRVMVANSNATDGAISQEDIERAFSAVQNVGGLDF